MRSIAFSRTALVASIAMVVVACSPTEGGVDAVPPTLPGEVTVSLECEAREADGNLHIYHRESRIPVALLDRFEEEMGVEVVEDQSAQAAGHEVTQRRSGHVLGRRG